ncbi:MAG: STAS domain-containing protein [Roseiflexaceae bacterium]|nr:STAS domain-containing protein [Roseiflexaceae bacterium]
MLNRAIVWIFRTQTADAEEQRRAHNVIIVALGMIVLATVSMLLTFSQAQMQAGQIAIIAIVVGIIIYSAAIIAARSGHVLLGSMLVIGITTLGTLATLPTSEVLTTPFYLTLAIMIAGATLRPMQIWITLVVVLIALWIVILIPPARFLATNIGRTAAFGSSFLLIMATLLTFLSARSTERALKSAFESRQVAQLAAAEAAQANADLERRVVERTQALSEAYERERAQGDELRASVETQQTLSQTILELAMPVIPLNEHVLIVPLIGNIDSSRAAQLLSTVLEQVERRRARGLILDVTGISVIDTAVAQTLLRVADANRLLGTRTVLVGIRPEVAQTLVTLGVDLHNLLTASSLQEGLEQLERTTFRQASSRNG